MRLRSGVICLCLAAGSAVAEDLYVENQSDPGQPKPYVMASLEAVTDTTLLGYGPRGALPVTESLALTFRKSQVRTFPSHFVIGVYR